MSFQSNSRSTSIRNLAQSFSFIFLQNIILRPLCEEILSFQATHIEPGYGENVAATADSSKRQKIHEPDSTEIPTDSEVQHNSIARATVLDFSTYYQAGLKKTMRTRLFFLNRCFYRLLAIYELVSYTVQGDQSRIFQPKTLHVQVAPDTETYRAEPAQIEEHGQSDHLPLQDAASEMSVSFEEVKTSASESSRQFNATLNLPEPLPPSSPIGGEVRCDGRESRGIAGAVCITPSPYEYAAQGNQEKSMGAAGQTSPGEEPSSNVPTDVSQTDTQSNGFCL